MRCPNRVSDWEHIASHWSETQCPCFSVFQSFFKFLESDFQPLGNDHPSSFMSSRRGTRIRFRPILQSEHSPNQSKSRIFNISSSGEASGSRTESNTWFSLSQPPWRVAEFYGHEALPSVFDNGLRYSWWALGTSWEYHLSGYIFNSELVVIKVLLYQIVHSRCWSDLNVWTSEQNFTPEERWMPIFQSSRILLHVTWGSTWVRQERPCSFIDIHPTSLPYIST